MANDYDKIFKENIETLIPYLAEKILGINAKTLVEIPDDLQVTTERKPDFLKKVINDDETYILHIEFQTIDDAEVPYRMLEYFGMLFRYYKIPVHQYVIYLGKHNPNLVSGFLKTNRFDFKFEAKYLQDFDYELFINSDKPEELLLAILSNFKNTEPVEVIKRLLEKLQRISGNENRYGKYANQLQTLSRIRNLDKQTFNQLENMPFIYPHEILMRDPLYKRGVDETKKDDVEGLIKLNILTPEQIASALNVPINVVMTIIEETNTKNQT